MKEKCKKCKHKDTNIADYPCAVCKHIHPMGSEEYIALPDHFVSSEDMVNHPPHYEHGMECIDEMILIFGARATADFCLLNAWKYRKRAVFKNGEEDMDKSDWYIKKYKELTTVKGNEPITTEQMMEMLRT